MKLVSTAILALSLLSGCNPADNHSDAFKVKSARFEAAYTQLEALKPLLERGQQCRINGEYFVVGVGMPCNMTGLIASAEYIQEYSLAYKKSLEAVNPKCSEDKLECKTMFEITQQMTDKEKAEWLEKYKDKVTFAESIYRVSNIDKLFQ